MFITSISGIHVAWYSREPDVMNIAPTTCVSLGRMVNLNMTLMVIQGELFDINFKAQSLFAIFSRVLVRGEITLHELSGPETKPGYSRFTDLNTEEDIWDFYHPLSLGEAAISWTLLAAIIVASWKAHALLKLRRELNGEAGNGSVLPR